MNDGFGRFLPRTVILCLGVLILVGSARNAGAQSGPEASPEELSPGGLDGFYVALGPVGSVTRSAGAWDGNFGAEAGLVRIREGSALEALGLSVGAGRYAREPERGLGRGTGRVWAELEVGISMPGGLIGGLGGGVVAEVDPVIPARWGAQGTIWVFAGVIPYVRVGRVEKNGTYIDFGIKVALPVLRI